MGTWSQPQCERCWISAEIEVHEDGAVVVRRPVRYVGSEDDDPSPVVQCAWCGGLTIVGIWRRANPATVVFPYEDPDAQGPPAE